MTEEHIVPPAEQPIRIRWLNAAGKVQSPNTSMTSLRILIEQNPTIQKPVAQHPSTPAIKMNKVTAPSVMNKAKTKVG
jgi:hypothetical protein